MSRKNQKKDEDNVAGKVLTGIAVGVTVAAAGAAIGYLGRHLFGAWQATQEKEQKVASAEQFPEYDFKKPEASNIDKEDQRRLKAPLASTTAKCANVEPVAIKKSPILLHDQLIEYYQEYVDIPKADILSAHKLVEEVLTSLSRYVRDPKLLKLDFLKFGDLVQFGSFTEGLAVIRPDKFDIMVPIKLAENCNIRAVKESEGSVHFEVCSSSCPALCDSNHRLMPRKLASRLLDPLQQACLNLGFSVEAALDNSVISLTVMTSDSQRQLSINLVPAVIIGSKLYMPNDKHSPNEDISIQWYASYARQEQWSVDRFDSSICGHRIAFKILKAIRLNHLEQFGQVSSYHLKHVLFHVLENLPDTSDWTDDAVGERLIDLLARLVQALNDHSLPHYFEQAVNLLYWVPKNDCVNLAKFIEKKLGANDIPSLLERRH